LVLIKQLEKLEYETHLDISDFTGINTYGEHSDIAKHELRECENFNILSNGDLKNRNGSQYLKAASSASKRGATAVINDVVWDIGAEEYLITQEGNSFYYQALLTPANPVLIVELTAVPFTVSNTVQCEMFLNGDKLRIFHEGGNKIIEWDGAAFVGRSMGIVKPVILAVDVTGAGNLTGKYTWGVEKVYQVSGVDQVASTPNRYTTARLINSTGTIDSKQAVITIEDTDLDNDTLWTHIRLWRSYNQNTDYSSTENPIDASGLPSELYEVALITKAEIEAGSLAAIATSTTLPVGNANVTAGNPGSVYTITDDCLDEELGELVDIDRIELSPLPAARTGAEHSNKIWVANVNDSTLDDDSGDNIYYSLWAGTKYSELYDPQQFIPTGRHGQKILKLISFEKDLIFLKEGKTGRIVDGNVSLNAEILDHRIGVKHKNAVEYIPGIGICGITTDNSDFKIFGFDYLWGNSVNGLEISKSLRNETKAMTIANISIMYLNGNIHLSDGTGNIWCLNTEQGKGWTKHVYPMNSLSERLFSFANETRGCVVSQSTHLVEIDDSTIVSDINTLNDVTVVMPVHWIAYKFRVNDGEHLLELDYFSFMGKMQYDTVAIPFINGVSWPLKTTDTETQFLTRPNIYAANTELRDKEYAVYFEPSTIGTYLYQVPVGNYIHFKVKSTAPCTVRTNKLWCVVDEDNGWGEFDPFQIHGTSRTSPAWGKDKLIETGSAPDTYTESGSESDTITEG
jgi:hypothetical protein